MTLAYHAYTAWLTSGVLRFARRRSGDPCVTILTDMTRDEHHTRLTRRPPVLL